MSKNKYENPLITRYASEEIQYIFSPDFKFKTWRKLWIALAEAEKELGLDITDEQIDELKKFQDNINYDVAQAREKEVRHDVMSHIYAYGQQCPKAKPIIHLGATSCYVGDNTDIITMREALMSIKKQLVNLMDILSKFVLKYKDLPTLGFTHFQSAQPVTVGKRASLWLQELMFDYNNLVFVLDGLKLLGSKGTTGTQASFMEIFDGDTQKVKKLDKIIAQKLGFDDCYDVSGQTYSRKIDYMVLSVLSGIAQSASKFGNDLRLLQNLKEIEEPFEKNQVGSSAMAYKRNPMRSERICSLSRYVISLALNPALTASTQWFERTLDDSANKRLAVAEAFLATDAVLSLYLNVSDGLVVYPKVIEKRLKSELPFMATENILMDAVKAGGDRQELHEKIREYSMQTSYEIKAEGKDNTLLEKIAADKAFGLDMKDLEKALDTKLYIGRSVQQCEDFVNEKILPIIEENKELLGLKAQINV
ncbi:MAG: adenylosuccinate lyase [Clostridia bacterium]|nr:adenylosuccinate lyase [Clostridia bacterium]